MDIMYSRVHEDPEVELLALKRVASENEKLDICTISCAGCTLFTLMSTEYEINSIDGYDINENHLLLVKFKLLIMAYFVGQDDKILNFLVGKLPTTEYKTIFEELVNTANVILNDFKKTISISEQEINMVELFMEKNQYNLLCSGLFEFASGYQIKRLVSNNVTISRQIVLLQIMSVKVWQNIRRAYNFFKKNDSFDCNYFYHIMFRDSYDKNNLPLYLTKSDRINKNISKLTLNKKDIFKQLANNEKKYHFINLSNSMDWIKDISNELCQLIDIIIKSLFPGGVCVIRRSKDSYNVTEVIKSTYLTELEILDNEHVDRTYLYKEVVIIRKKS